MTANYDFGKAKFVLHNQICDSLFKTRRLFDTDRRAFNVHLIGSALLSQNYWCHVTSTLYKPDTSLRRTVGAGPDGIRLNNKGT